MSTSATGDNYEMVSVEDKKLADLDIESQTKITSNDAIKRSPSYDDVKKGPTGRGYDRILEYQSSRSMSRSSKPQNISWSGVGFSVGDKQILTKCWGSVPAGETCAIMGPSGAGKSSIMNVLAGRSVSGGPNKITGTIKVGGNVIDPASFKQNIAYVMQDDALMATATPREALEFSAKLRLPPDTTTEQITLLVDAMLEELGLEGCADVMIGGALIKGISGGQKKRTSVGIEIITSPALLFLDEPTSGLDSFSAFNLVNLLQKVAQNTKIAVLCTIHQPSSEVFFRFDNVIFMKDGYVFYQGPVKDIVPYFSKFGYECPNNYNPSDFIMFLSQTETLAELEAKGVMMSTSTSENGLVEAITSTTGEKILVEPKAGTLKQLYLLIKRELISTRRDKAALIGRFGITIFLNTLYGLIFFGAGSKDDSDPTNFNAHFGALTMVAISSMFGSAQPVMLMFPFERPMFLREYSTGTYSCFAYFTGKVVIELPLTLLQTIVQYILIYFLVDLQGSWIQLVLASWGLAAASCSIAVVLGCLVTDVKQVTEFAPLLFVPQLMFAGFFIRLSQIPVFLRWAQYLCSLKYAMNLILYTEFNPKNPNCQGGAHKYCAAVLDNNEIVTGQWWIYVLILLILFVGFRVLGALILAQKAKSFY